MPAKPATILGSELHTIKSRLTGKQYRMTVGLPYEYYDKPSKKWPVVFLVDGNWYFGLVTDMVRAMAACGTTTDAIVVGIGYPNNKKKKRGHEEFYRRDFDLTPIANENFEKENGDLLKRKITTGGANKLLNFIQHELMPFVNKKYRISPRKRVLVGHSLGGLFAAYALFEKPRLFTHYLICSPSLWYHAQYIFECEKNFSKRHKQLKANVYLSAGGLEKNANSSIASNTLRFSALLQSRNYKGLSIVQEIFNDKKHCEVIAPSYQAGLQWALQN